MKTQNVGIKAIIVILFMLSLSANGFAQTYRYWYYDNDGDGWGDIQNSYYDNTYPGPGYVLNSQDCNDYVFNGSLWKTVGNAGFSAGKTNYTNMAINANGIPFVIYQDVDSSYKATVKRFDGTSWVNVGAPAFSDGEAHDLSLAFNAGGTPYVVYKDGAHSFKATVKKFDGTNWVNVGSQGFSGARADYTDIILDASGTPYVVYSDWNGSATGGKTTVMKFNGTAWVLVGTAQFSTSYTDYTTIAIDNAGTLYVAYRDYGFSNKTVVKKFNGTSWVNVGTQGFSAGTASYVSLALDPDGTPYIGYMDGGTSSKATVMKYTSAGATGWATVGNAGFSAGQTAYNTLVVDAAGVPYMAYDDIANNSEATVMKFNGTNWIVVGAVGFSSSSTAYTTIALDPQAIPYVVYEDGTSQKATVMKLAFQRTIPTVTISTYTNTISAGTSANFIATADGVQSYPSPAPSYQWYKNGLPIVGATLSTLTTSAIANNDTFYCLLTANNTDACVDPTPVASNKLGMTVTAAKWYKDADGDGLGNPNIWVISNTQPAGYVINNLDCDDSTPDTNSWSVMGANTGFGRTNATNQNYMAVDKAGHPYVVYWDNLYSGKLTVKQYNGTAWVTIGAPGFSPLNASSPNIAVDPSGTPYVAFWDVSNYKPTVMKYNGTSWVNVGTPGFSSGTTNQGPSIAIDGNGVVYVAYADNSLGGKVVVMKYNGSSWVPVGTAGFSAGAITPSFIRAIPLVVDASGTPWVAYTDNANNTKMTVMKFNGTSWTTVGNAGFGSFTSYYGELAVDANGTPYVAFQESTDINEQLAVMKYNGANWEYVGLPGFSGSIPQYIFITTNAAGIPYVTYQDIPYDYTVSKTIVRKFNGTNWDDVSFLSAGVAPFGLISGPKSIVYLGYVNGTAGTTLNMANLDPHLANASLTVSASQTGIVRGDSMTFTATTSVSSGQLVYQWYKNSLPIPGAVSSTYKSSALSNGDTIYCKISGISANCYLQPDMFSDNKIVVGVQQYFRTIAAGNYSTVALWQGSADSIAWATAFGIPTADVRSVEIRHIIMDDRSAATARVPNFTISSSGVYNAGSMLSIKGNFANNGTLNTSGTVEFYGSNAQSISGIQPVYFTNILISNTSPLGVTITSNQYVRKLVSFNPGSILNTGDKLTLISDINATAGIGSLTGGADVIGKMHYQRYIPGGSSHRKWRFMAMPLQNQTIVNSWQQDIYVTGPGTGGKDCGTDGNMIRNSAGFDQNQTGMNHPTDTALTSTIFSWDEQANAWRGVPSTGGTIDPTTGYRVFIRGDRHVEGCALLTIMPDSVSPATLHGFGAIEKGTVTKNLTYTAGKGEGWNLLSNPYPCPVSWTSLYNNNDIDNMSATVSIINPINGMYAYYNAVIATGVNLGGDQIGSGQSFFVQAMDNIPFNITENDKSYVPNAGLFGKTNPSKLKIRLQGTDVADEAVIVQWSNATYGMDKHLDAGKLPALEVTMDVDALPQQQTTSIASETSVSSKPLVFNFIPFTQATDRIPLYTTMNANASYTLSFPEMEIQDLYHLWLHDRYTNTYIDIREQNTVNIQTQADTATYNKNRFELVIINSMNASDSVVITGNKEITINTQYPMIIYYPVPTLDILNIQLNNTSTGTAVISVYDITGKEVLNKSYTLRQSNETIAMSLNNIASGTYSVKATINGQPLPAQKLIKH